MEVPKGFRPESKDLEGNVKRLLSHQHPPKPTKFEVLHAKGYYTTTYAKSIAKLKEQGKKPFTFTENIEARIADYDAKGKNAELFKTWLSSITGIAYKAYSTKFKLILRSDKLENMPDSGQDSVPIDYDAEQGLEFDRLNGKYNQDLTREEVKNHGFWLAAVNGDKEKLDKYVDIWFDKTGAREGMGIYLRVGLCRDELRALTLNDDDFNSDASDHNYLFSNPRFVSSAK